MTPDSIAAYDFMCDVARRKDTLPTPRPELIPLYVQQLSPGRPLDINISSVTERVISELPRIVYREATEAEAAQIEVARRIDRAADNMRLVPRYAP